MHTVALVFTVCSLLKPSVCEPHKLVFAGDADLTPMQCMSRAQEELAKWYSTHPGWRVTRYGCEREKLEAKI